MGLSARVRAAVEFTKQDDVDLSTARADFTGWGTIQFGDGTGAGLADIVHHQTMTLAASATANIDLAGTLVDPIGGAAVFAKVKAIAVRARETNTNNVVIGGAASNGWLGPLNASTSTITLPPGGQMLLAAPVNGWSVVAATGDLLKVANSGAGTSVVFDVVIIGTSA